MGPRYHRWARSVNHLRWLSMVCADIRALWRLHRSHICLRRIFWFVEDVLPGGSPLRLWSKNFHSGLSLHYVAFHSIVVFQHFLIDITIHKCYGKRDSLLLANIFWLLKRFWLYLYTWYHALLFSHLVIVDLMYYHGSICVLTDNNI